MKTTYTPMLSIIVPFRSDSVVVTLNSLSQCAEKERVEVILVSDGLDTAILNSLERYYTGLDVKVVATEKCGRIGHLRNLGIQRAKSDSFYFIDSDCWLKEDAIARAIASKGTTRVLKGRNVFIGKNWISRLDAQLRDERYESHPEFAYCPNLVVHANVFEQLGLFKSQYTYGSDGEFAKRISESTIKVKYDKDLILYHDCTNTFGGVFGKWMNMGEARYCRYQNETVENKFATYFPNLFNWKRGAFYNGAALLCDMGRAMGMLRAWRSKKSVGMHKT